VYVLLVLSCSFVSICYISIFFFFVFVFFFFFFFFSSRRRHTRWPRDWSSDVCSSDLAPHGFASSRCSVSFRVSLSDSRRVASRRSEERRVGKECRSRWSPEH